MDELSVVGKPVPNIHGIAQVKGEAIYAGDIFLPRMLHGKILRSPYPHARVVSIDVSKAEKLPGVKAVVTGRDIPREKYGIAPKAGDEYALAIDKVRYIGDEVAAVAAVDEETAEEALELIDVEYEILSAIFDPEEAMKPGAPLIHDVPNNISFIIRKEMGDVDRAFEEADYVRQDRFTTQAQAHAPLEPHAAVASYDPSGKVTLWSAKQIPFFLRRNLAKTMGLAESAVRVIKPPVGGGFGGKIDMFALDFCAAWLSKMTGRPVKIVYTREESMTATRYHYPMVIELKTGVKRDGTILAQEFKMIADGGAYNSTAPILLTLSALFSMLPYKVPNIRFAGYHVYTNKPATGPLRGHGVPQMRFASESQMDMIAQDLGIDPVEMRLKNAIVAGMRHPHKLTIRTCGFSETLEKASQAIGWKEKRGKRNGRGVGVGCSGYVCGVKNMRNIGSGAIIKVDENGAITLLTGAADIGQGCDTVLCQIAAEVLGVTVDDIRITAADTELTPLDAGTFGSGVTLRAGNAVKAAALSARNKILEVVAEHLEANISDLEAKGGRIYVKGSPERGVAFKEALKMCRYAGRPMPIVGRGFYQPPTKEPYTLLTVDGDISPAYTFSTQAAEVEVDRETGVVRVLKLVSAHDGGNPINPLTLEGQLDGSMVMGMGWATMENPYWEDGQALNPTLLDYRTATSMDVPEMEGIHVSTFDPEGPFGAKEAGEGTMIGVAAAIANAIYDAVGVRIKSLPLSPEKVLRAIEERR